MTRPDQLARDLERLEAIVRELEADDVELDHALALFEEGVKHLRSARARLEEAETKAAKVLEDSAGALKLTGLDRREPSA